MIQSSLFALFILILGSVVQYKKYGTKYVIHPSFWFFLVWTLSTISFLLYMMAGLDFIIFDESLVIELFNYISFTALCFILVAIYYNGKIKNKIIRWETILNRHLYKIIATSVFIFTIINFSLNKGFNLIVNREMMATDIANIQNNFIAIIWQFLSSINYPLVVYSGFVIGENIINSVKTRGKVDIFRIRFVYFFPIIVEIINTISSGGRSGIFHATVLLSLGFFIKLFNQQQLEIQINVVKKMVTYIIIFFISFSLFTTYVNAAREETSFSNSRSFVRWSEYPIIAPFSGLIQYLTDHYPGYQLRRKDTSFDKLMYGQISLSGITMFPVPVISQLAGIRISIQNIFSLYAPNIKQGFGDDYSSTPKLWGSTTATIYYLFYQDFGYWGTFVFILLLVLLTQKMYINIFTKRRKYFVSIFFLVLLTYFWSSTIFSHHILGNWTTRYIYPLIIIDLITIIFNENNRQNSHA